MTVVLVVVAIRKDSKPRRTTADCYQRYVASITITTTTTATTTTPPATPSRLKRVTVAIDGCFSAGAGCSAMSRNRWTTSEPLID